MSDRGDELVVAGSAPRGQAPTKTPFDMHHRGTVFILAVDLVLLGWGTLAVMEAAGAGTGPGTSFVIVLPSVLLWSAYRRRQRWAYWLSVGVMGLVLLVFFTLSMLNLWSGLAGQTWDLVLAFFLLWATVGTGRRIRLHLLPAYRSAYLQHDLGMAVELEAGEMLAACPSCFAVLAIRPEALSSDDRCPHCEQPLVSEALAARHDEES